MCPSWAENSIKRFRTEAWRLWRPRKHTKTMSTLDVFRSNAFGFWQSQLELWLCSDTYLNDVIWSWFEKVVQNGTSTHMTPYDTYALLGSRWVTISLRVDHLSASSRPRSRCVLRRPFNQKLQRPNVSTWCKLHNKKDCWLVNTVASYNFVNFCELPPSSEDRFRSLLTFHRTHSMSPASACSSHLTK